MGQVVFREVQWGKESSAAHGTPVACTRALGAECNVPKDRNWQFISDQNGRRAGANRTAVYQYFADGITLNFPQGYFQALPGVFSACIKGDITPTTASGGVYTYTYTPIYTSTASNMVDSLTMRVGDDTEQYVMEYVQFRSVVIAGSAGDDAPVTITANGFGRQVTVGAMTSSLTIGTVEPMVANMAQLWVNNTFAVLGSGSAISQTLVDWNIEVFGGVHPKFFADGARYFSTTGQNDIYLVAAFTFEGNSTADGYFDLFQAGTARAIRFRLTSGTSYITGTTPYSINIDAYGKFEEVIPLASDRDGNSLHTAIFRSMDDGTNAIRITVVSNNSAI